jgi:fructokinase
MQLNDRRTEPRPTAGTTILTVIGESLVDIISDPRRPAATPAHPGGSPLNVAVGAARLGLKTNLVTHYAEDRYGLMIEEHLQTNGVHVINGGTTPTSTALATLGHDGAADPNCRPAISADAAAARRQAEAFVAASDIVKASDEDLAWLYPERTPDETLQAWLELGPAVVALTRGASGPVVLSGTGRVEITAEPVTVADTVGAGDSFMAGFISGLAQLEALGAGGRQRLQTLTLDQLHALAAYANRAAAITCTRQGANPPRLAELGPLPVPSPAQEH